MFLHWIEHSKSPKVICEFLLLWLIFERFWFDSFSSINLSLSVLIILNGSWPVSLDMIMIKMKMMKMMMVRMIHWFKDIQELATWTSNLNTSDETKTQIIYKVNQTQEFGFDFLKKAKRLPFKWNIRYPNQLIYTFSCFFVSLESLFLLFLLIFTFVIPF